MGTCSKMLSMTEKSPMNYERIIANDVLVLEQLQPTDAEMVFSLVEASRTELAEYLPWVDDTKTSEDTRAYILKTLEDRKDGTAYHYGMLFNNEIVGHISLMHADAKSEPEIGYWIATEAAGNGITTDAVSALTDFGLHTLQLDNIVIKAEPANIASNRVAEKCGYLYDGQEHHVEFDALMNNWRIYR